MGKQPGAELGSIHPISGVRPQMASLHAGTVVRARCAQSTCQGFLLHTVRLPSGLVPGAAAAGPSASEAAAPPAGVPSGEPSPSLMAAMRAEAPLVAGCELSAGFACCSG